MMVDGAWKTEDDIPRKNGRFRRTATSFRGGTLDCWYGGGTIDLRGATLAPNGARLDVRAIFGGAQIVVPEAWHVSTRINGLGGAGEMVTDPAQIGPALDRAFASGVPYLVNVITDVEAMYPRSTFGV